MLVILPFEKDFYKKHGIDVSFTGHPLLDALANDDPSLKSFEKENKPIIALLPGSRRQEIARMLPMMLEAMESFHDHQAIVAAAPAMSESFYNEFLHDYPGVKLVSGKTYSLLASAQAALVTSGTATLEAALLGVPEVVCYKGGTVSYLIARSLVKVPYISLVNLVMEKETVKELIQNELTVENLRSALRKIIDPEHRERILADFTVLKQKLGGPGASARAAETISRFMA